jgi:hypothetical protein
MNYTYTDRPVRGDWYRFKDKSALPSDIWYGNCFAGFQEDAIGLRNPRRHRRQHVDVGFPTFLTPSRPSLAHEEIVGQILAEVPKDEITKIVSTNCADLYRFDVPAS